MKRILWMVLIGFLIFNCVGCTGLFKGRNKPGSGDANENGQGALVKQPAPETTVKIHLLTEDSRYLVPLTLKAPLDEDPPTTALRLMLSWAAKDGLKSPFPVGTVFTGVEIANGLATVDLSMQLPVSMNPEEEASALNAVLLTLKEFPDAKKTLFTVNGNKSQTLAGNVDISLPLSPPVAVNSDGSVPKSSTMKLVVWYPYKGTCMVPITKYVPKTVAPARAAVEELIRGPGNITGLDHPIPTGTRLLGIKIKDEVCWVDFSKEIKSNHWGGTDGESSTVNSIVYTLTEFPNIKTVQLMTEGKVGGSIAGHISLDTPIERGYVNLRRLEDSP